MATVSISDAEWQLMNVVWENEPLTAQELLTHLKPIADWAPGTVKSMVHRLVQKEVLTYDRDGHRYVYRARAPREACIEQASASFLERVFEGRSSSLLAHFLNHSRLTPAEISQLRKILREQEAQS